MTEPVYQTLSAAASRDLPLLGEADGATYHRLEVVVVRRDGVNRLYCLHADWADTPAGRLVQSAQIIECQQQQIQLLAERLARAEQRAEQAEQHVAVLVAGVAV